MKIQIKDLEASHLHHKLPTFRVGDLVKIILKIVEGESERLQAFEGTVIGIGGHGLSKTFTVRKISYGIGVERTIPFNSPRIDKLEVIRSGHVRRSKLYFLRERTGKAARLDEKEKADAATSAKAASAPHAPAAVAPVAGASH